METKRLIDRDVSVDHASIDLESGTKSIIVDEHGASRDSISRVGEGKAVLSKVWNGFVGDEEERLKSKEVPINGEASLEKEVLLQNPEAEKPKKKKRPKKPPKPPRPPKPPSPLDSSDEKLIREMSELATMKRARIERMKELKRMKNNAKSASSMPSTNLGALVITILFCLVIIWQGVFSRNSSSLSFHGSPESSVVTNGGLISVQFYNNVSVIGSDDSTSASTNNTATSSRLNVHGEESRVSG